MKNIFGPVMQNAFVVDDLEKALHHWTHTMGVGPFYVFDHVQFSDINFRGKPSAIDMTAAMGYWGDLQIELVQQHNRAPSIYREFLDRGYAGMQHMGVVTHDFDAHVARLAPLGITPTQYGQVAGGGRFAYVSSDFHPGGMIELIEAGEGILGLFKIMRDAARDWDGKEPVRRF